MPSLPPVTQDDQIVEINIDPQKLSPTIPQPTQGQSIELSTEQREAIKRGEAIIVDGNGTTPPVNGEVPVEKPFGRPCGYCKNKTEIDKKVQVFMDRCTTSEKGKTVMPFLEELCLELDIDEDTMSNWANKKTKDDSLEHLDFFGAYKRIRMIQKLRLQQRTMGRYNPTGAIFLLKANHGYMESEKKILAGDKNEPLTIEIIEEGRRNVEEN